MSELIELVLSLVFDGIVDLSWPDTKPIRIFWGVILVILAGVIWWEIS
jgi:hypothetical protein